MSAADELAFRDAGLVGQTTHAAHRAHNAPNSLSQAVF
jgi:hypothetical protein